MRCLTVAILASLSGCGDNVRGGYSAGTRLVPLGYVFEDGTTQPRADSFFDVARDEACAVQTWADGARYCTPAAAPFVFADAFCRTPIAKLDPQAPAAYAETPFVAPDGTAYVSKLRPVGNGLGDVPYYKSVLGSCIGPYTDDASVYAEVTATELAEGDFVQVTRTLDDIDDELSAVRLTAPDGLSLPIGFYDRSDGIDCAARDAPDSDSTACAPAHALAASGFFSDPQCTVPSANATAVDRDPTLQAIALDLDGCKRDFALTTNRLYNPAYAVRPDGSCVVADSAGDLLYAAGEPLADHRLARTRLESPTRFSPIVDGWVPLAIRDAYVHDNAGNFDCKPVDGVCRPDAIATTALFVDPGCETPIDVAYVDPPTCGDPPKFAMKVDKRVFALGDVYLQPLFAGNSNSDVPCIAAAALPGKEPHVLGDELHLGSVAEAVLR